MTTDKQLHAQHEARPWGERPRVDQKPDAMASAYARTELRRYVRPGMTVYTRLVGNVSKSGMTRHLKLYVVHKGAIRDITAQAARAKGDKATNKDGQWCIKTQGCGMDMGFHEVYGLSRALYPNGFKTTKRTGTRNGNPIGSRDPDGGYALKHRWL